MSEFRKLAQLTLDDIFNLVESKFDDFEVDFEEENLHIESSSKNLIFIVSIHSPTSQIWLSSPYTGAHHFELFSKNPIQWVSTRDKNIKLLDLIENELSR